MISVSYRGWWSVMLWDPPESNQDLWVFVGTSVTGHFLPDALVLAPALCLLS